MIIIIELMSQFRFGDLTLSLALSFVLAFSFCLLFTDFSTLVCREEEEECFDIVILSLPFWGGLSADGRIGLNHFGI